VRRFGLKAAIVAAGAGVAAGTIHRTTYVSHTPLVERVVASAPVNVKTPWGTSPTADSSIAPGGLDAGLNHSRIAYWVDRLSTTLSSDFTQTLQRKSKYADMIEKKLAAKKMPTDLVYLAMIESNFNPNAKSPVKALGLWQFMSGTARQFGLKVRGRVDERRDPERETDAAVAYLSSLHDQLGSWYLAAAAYNSGPGTVLKALRAVTGKSTGTDEDFFRILPQLPRETQDYVPKLIATARVASAPERYGIKISEATPAVKPVAKRVATKKARATKVSRPARKVTVKLKAPRKSKTTHRTRTH
jgi:membrane-bound lytic murein transglycosylase D